MTTKLPSNMVVAADPEEIRTRNIYTRQCADLGVDEKMGDGVFTAVRWMGKNASDTELLIPRADDDVAGKLGATILEGNLVVIYIG